jgi:RNA polymerase sigma-70 factor (ECF subfamily)
MLFGAPCARAVATASARIAPLMANPSHSAATFTPDMEAALVRRAQQGDLDAFNRLVDIYQRAVYNLCLRMVGSAPAAEDGAQETFLHAWRHLDTFRGANFRPWLMRIAANACTDELRRRGRRPAVSLDAPAPGSEEPIDVPDPTAGPETEALRGEQQTTVQAALLRLPDDQRLAVVMCDIQGYAYEEIAVAMRTSIGTVKSRIARGREKLRGLLASEREQMR